MENFDAETIFYDCYRVGDAVHLSGPPLFNLQEPVLESLREAVEDAEIDVRELDRTSHVVIRGLPESADSITLVLAGQTFVLPISDSRTGAFKDRIVLVTKSKNNEL
ncbi:hypothetical protein, partial [Brevibacterium casei]|uniref:hypothetical protein n=1 Tax=Brevibacterium casei TaxID=33889 RepID=UPI001C930A21